MDAEERFHQKRLGYIKNNRSEKDDIPLAKITLNRASKHVSIRGDIVVRTASFKTSSQKSKSTWTKWLTRKLVASTVSSRMMRQQGQSENQTMSSLECARVNIGEEREQMDGKGRGRQRLRYIDGDVPRCMRHNDDKSTSTAAQPHTREKEKGSSNEEEEKEIEEGGSKEVKKKEAKKEKESKDPSSNSTGKKGKHYEKRTKKKMSPSSCYKRM